MRTLFADALYWVALLDARDQWHAQALRASREHRKARVVTTDAVLLEVLATFSRTGPVVRRAAAQFVQRLYTRPTVEVVPHDRAMMLAAIDLYDRRPDREYSLADCISMLVMRERGIVEALTHDHHFTQEGFAVLFGD